MKFGKLWASAAWADFEKEWPRFEGRKEVAMMKVDNIVEKSHW